MPDKSLGQVACETYHETVGTGAIWDSMGSDDKAGWEAAAEAVVEAAAEPEPLGDIELPETSPTTPDDVPEEEQDAAHQ